VTSIADLELQLKGLVLVRALLEMRGASAGAIDTHTREIARIRARLAAATIEAKGGGAHSAAA
jgi:hypothetical protein